MQSSKCKFEHVDLDLLTQKCLPRDMGNTCEVSSLYLNYHMSNGNTSIIIVQKHCNMQITNLGFTFDIFNPPPPPPPPPQKKKQQQRNNIQFQLQTLPFKSKIKMVFSIGHGGQSAMVKKVYPYNFDDGDIIRKALQNRNNMCCYTSFCSLFVFCFHYDTNSFVSIHVYI